MRNEYAEKARPSCRGVWGGGNAALKSFLTKTEQSLQTGCLLPFPFRRWPSWRESSRWEGRRACPFARPHVLSSSLPPGGNTKAAIQNSDTSAGAGGGRVLRLSRPWNFESAPPARPSGDRDPSSSSSLGGCGGWKAGPAARSFLGPPGQSRPAGTLNNKLCILDPSAAQGRFSCLSWRPSLL